ncbi:MAG TPA: hypothetical protein VKA74_16055 [Myxococcota bacterium]|nr:hypothetical protein [Myxococcota bacterium]
METKSRRRFFVARGRLVVSPEIFPIEIVSLERSHVVLHGRTPPQV